jgi:hypothetical protein
LEKSGDALGLKALLMLNWNVIGNTRTSDVGGIEVEETAV